MGVIICNGGPLTTHTHACTYVHVRVRVMCTCTGSDVGGRSGLSNGPIQGDGRQPSYPISYGAGNRGGGVGRGTYTYLVLLDCVAVS